MNKTALIFAAIASSPILSDLLRQRIESNIHVDEEYGCHVWTGFVSNNGHPLIRIALSKEEKTNALVTRVLRGFELGTWPDKLVTHACNNRLCVNPEHFEDRTLQENVEVMIAEGRNRYGEQHYRAQLTDERVREILGSNDTTAVLARAFGVLPSTVLQVRAGKTWRHVSGAA